MLAIVVAWVTIFGPAQPRPVPQGGRRLGVFYVNNWQQIFGNVSYFARFAPRRPAQPPLVALGRGAVLHLLAVPAAARGQARPRARRCPPACGRGWPLLTLGAGARLVDPDGGPLPPEPRPLAGLLRHRHPRRRLLFGAALAMVWPSRRLSRRIAPQAPATCSTASASLGLADHRADDLADRRVLVLPLPRRLRPPLAGDGDGADAAGPPGLPARPDRSAGGRCAGSASAPTGSTSGTSRSSSSPRPAASPTAPEPLARAAPGGGDLRRRGALLALRRGADPPRRDRPLLRPPPRGRLEMASRSRRRCGWRSSALGLIVLIAAAAGMAGRQLGLGRRQRRPGRRSARRRRRRSRRR